jgi:hypothetical protein
MKRLLSAAVAISVLPIAVGVPASAAPATHDVYLEDYDAYEPLAAGDAAPCVPWSGTLHEVLSGLIKLVTINSGHVRSTP